jgi:hypothetical protein
MKRTSQLHGRAARTALTLALLFATASAIGLPAYASIDRAPGATRESFFTRLLAPGLATYRTWLSEGEQSDTVAPQLAPTEPCGVNTDSRCPDLDASAREVTSYEWVGPAEGGSWTAPANWRPVSTFQDGNGYPDCNDTAFINSADYTIGGDAGAANLEFNGGNLTINGRARLGSLNARQALTLKVAGTLWFDSSVYLPPGSSLVNDGRVEIGGPIARMDLPGVSTVTNNGVIEIQKDGVMNVQSSSLTNSPSGVIVKTRTVGCGTSLMQLAGLTNDGQINVQGGTLLVTGNGTSSGAFTAAADATLQFGGGFNGTHNLTAASSVGGAGTVNFIGQSTVNINGAYAPGKTFVSHAMNANLNSAAPISLASVEVFSGVLNLGHDATINDLRLSSVGKIRSNHNVDVTGALTSFNGTLGGSGRTRIAAGARLDIGLPADVGNPVGEIQLLDTHRLENAGTVNVRARSRLLIFNNSTFVNDGAVQITADGQVDGYGSSGSQETKLVNNGTVLKQGAGDAVFRAKSFTNTGRIEVQEGTLYSGGSGAHNGTFDVAGGATLYLAPDLNGTVDLGGGQGVTGAGTVGFYGQGTVNVDGGYTVAGTNITGNVRVNFKADTTIRRLGLSGGGTLGDGNVTVTEAFDLAYGTIRGAGTLRVARGATMTVNAPGSPILFDSRRLENAGTMNLVSTSPLQVFGTSSLVNSGIIDIQGDGGLMGSGVSGAHGGFTNTGRVLKTAGGGASLLAFDNFSNAGTIEARTGALNFGFGAFTQTDSGRLILNNADLTAGRTFTLDGGTLAGNGRVSVNFVNGGAVSPGVAPRTAGSLEFLGTYTQTASGKLNIELGGTEAGTGFDQIVTGGPTGTTTQLGGTLNVSLIDNYRPTRDGSFQIVRYSARAGDFATVNGLELNGEPFFALDYRPQEAVLTSGNGGPARPWADIHGPLVVRANAPQVTYRVTYGNSGGQFAVVPMIVVVPYGESVEVPALDRRPLVPINDPEARAEFGRMPTSFDHVASDGSRSKVIPFFAFIPPGSTLSLDVNFTKGCVGGAGSPEGKVYVGSPINDSDNGECYAKLAENILDFLPGSDCVKLLRGFMVSEAASVYFTGGAASATSVIASAALDALKCAGDLIPATKLIKNTIKVIDTISKLEKLTDLGLSCGGVLFPNQATAAGSGSRETLCVGSIDPNMIIGPSGVGDERHITGEAPLSYAVYFENKPDATAPAQDVVVTDQLDVEKYDLDTFTLGGIGFGDTRVEVPADLQEFERDVDLRPAKNLIARIHASLDKRTGLVTWRFASIDPATGEPTTDPLAGFLPPNRNAPEGEGFVIFNVRAKKSLPSGAEIKTSADIVFDTNPAINTGEWSNRVDNVKPESRVAPLPAEQLSSDFLVEWAGSDAHSGIANYTVYVSVDDEPFAVWLQNTPDTKAVFNGQVGHTYRFYSRGRDRTGNLEASKTAAEASTTVGESRATVTTLEASAPESTYGESVTFTASVTGAGGVVREGGVVFKSGESVLAGPVALDGEGHAVFTTAALDAAGSPHSIRAEYGGTTRYGASGAGLTHTVNKATPSVNWENPADIDAGTPLGGAQLNATASLPGEFTYTPPAGTVLGPGEGQTLSVTFVPEDAANYNTASRTVSINVRQGNRPPVADAQSVTTAEDVPKAITLSGSDADGDALTYSVVARPSHGTLSALSGNVLTYTPSANYSGPDGFTFEVSDGKGGSATAAVGINVSPVNDPPSFTAAAPPSQSVEYSDAIQPVVMSVTDVETQASLLEVAPLTTLPAGLGLQQTPGTGVWTLAGNANVAAGTHKIPFRVTDTAGASDIVAVTINVAREQAATAYTGDTAVLTAGPSITSATVRLGAHLEQQADGAPGDISLARVTFELFKGGNLGGTPDVVVGGVAVDANGDALTTYTLAADIYNVNVRVDGANGHWVANPVGIGVISVTAAASGQSSGGGGWIPDAGSANGKANFGFNVRAPVRPGGLPGGNSTFVFRGTDGFNYVVKSNSWQGGYLNFLAEPGVSPAVYSRSNFKARCNVQKVDPSTGRVVESWGNYTLEVDTSDGDRLSPKKGDGYAITISDGRGQVWRQTGTRDALVTLGGGNVTNKGR